CESGGSPGCDGQSRLDTAAIHTPRNSRSTAGGRLPARASATGRGADAHAARRPATISIGYDRPRLWPPGAVRLIMESPKWIDVLGPAFIVSTRPIRPCHRPAYPVNVLHGPDLSQCSTHLDRPKRRRIVDRSSLAEPR